MLQVRPQPGCMMSKLSPRLLVLIALLAILSLITSLFLIANHLFAQSVPTQATQPASVPSTTGFDYEGNELSIVKIYEIDLGSAEVLDHSADWQIEMIAELRRTLRRPPLSENRPPRWEGESLFTLRLYEGTPLSFVLYANKTKICDSSGRCWAIDYSKK